MGHVPTPAEVFPKSRNNPNFSQTDTSALGNLGLENLVSYPDWESSVEGIDHETGLLVTASISHAFKQYRCMTCEGTIPVHEENVLISGIHGVRKRDGYVFDHHHTHTDCFHDFELRFWDDCHLIPKKVTDDAARQRKAVAQQQLVA